MERSHLDRILDGLKEEPIPHTPPDLEGRVIQAIVSRDLTASTGGPLSFLWRSSFSLTCTVGLFALGIGFVTGAAVSNLQAPKTDVSVRQALALDIFEDHFGITPVN